MDVTTEDVTSGSEVDLSENAQSLQKPAEDEEEESKKSSLPQNRYSRNELLALKGARHSRMKPTRLSKEFELEDGKWDPDKWFCSIDRSADTWMQRTDKYSTRFTHISTPEEKFNDTKRSGVDFKRTSIHGMEDENEIILGPQRNSFTKGCNALRTSKWDQSPHKDGRERNQRIGSGRVQVGDRRPEKIETDLAERRGGGGGGSRFEHESKDERYRRGEKREMNSRNWNQGDRSSDGLYRPDVRVATGSRSMTETSYQRQAVVPEWFTRGPSSRADTIELGGFSLQSDNNEADKRKKHPMEVNALGSGDSVVKRIDSELETEKKSRSVETKQQQSTDINCTAESTSDTEDNVPATDREEQRHHHRSKKDENSPTDNVSQSKSQEFDFNDFFKVDSVLNIIESVPPKEGSSRFKAFFNLQPSSQMGENESGQQQQSSLLELFPCLNDIINGHANSPLPPSPSLPSVFGHQMTSAADEAEEKKRFLMMLERANLLPGKGADSAANLKELFKVQSTVENTGKDLLQRQTVFPSQHKALLAEELEADLLTNAKEKPRQQVEKSLAYSTMAQQPVIMKVTTQAELEGNLMSNKAEKTNKVEATDNQEMAAFNRLLDLVQGHTSKSSNSGNQNVLFSNNNNRVSEEQQTTKPNEQQLNALSSQDEQQSGCPSLVLSLLGNQTRIPNRPFTPVTSSPIMFGSQPPTNLMMPRAMRSVHGQPAVPAAAAASAAAAGGGGFTLWPSNQSQGNVVHQDGVAVLPQPSAAPSIQTSNKENLSLHHHHHHPTDFLQDPTRINRMLDASAAAAGASGKMNREHGKASPAFLPTAVMRKMVTDRAAAAGRSSTEKTGTDGPANSDRNSLGFNLGIESSYSTNSVSQANNATALNETAYMHNQHGLSIQQQTQLLEIIKNSLTGQPYRPPQGALPVNGNASQQSHLARSHVGLPNQSLRNYSNTQVANEVDQITSSGWSTSTNKNILSDMNTQLRGQGQGPINRFASTHQPNTSTSQLHQPSKMGPAEMAAFLRHLQGGTGGQVLTTARPLTNVPPAHSAAPTPIGRPIVKGSGLQTGPNQSTTLAGRTERQQIPIHQPQQQQQQQQQAHVNLAYPVPHGGGPYALLGPGGMYCSTTASSLSNGNYNSADLSRLFGQSLPRHPVMAQTSFPEQKAITVDDLERKFALGTSSSSRLS